VDASRRVMIQSDQTKTAQSNGGKKKGVQLTAA